MMKLRPKVLEPGKGSLGGLGTREIGQISPH